MIKIIIFDLGSVVFKEDWEALSKEMVEKMGISTLIRSEYDTDINEEYNKSIIGKSDMHKVFEKICKKKGIKKDIDEICNYYKRLYQKYQKIDGRIIDLIKKLKEKYKVIALTNAQQLHFESHNEKGLLDLFDSSFASFQLKIKKPDRKIFEYVLNKLKVDFGEAVLIDDNIKNIEIANSLRIKTIQFKDYEQLIEDLKREKIL